MTRCFIQYNSEIKHKKNANYSRGNSKKRWTMESINRFLHFISNQTFIATIIDVNCTRNRNQINEISETGKKMNLPTYQGDSWLINWENRKKKTLKIQEGNKTVVDNALLFKCI